jgi:2-dehydro-3-deoxygluconokinase
VTLEVRASKDCRYDLVALGEVMLRFDPGEGRIATARSFRVWEGGGEYNVARGLRRCFGMRTAIVTAVADNPIGRLIEDLILQGGVDTSGIRWVPYDGIGSSVRNGLNFTERGFGVRAAIGCSDRANTAASQLAPGEIDWHALFGAEGTRWFHTGGIFTALSDTTPLVAREAMAAARDHGVVVSYDLNYRPSLWNANGGVDQARDINRFLAPLVDVMFGNEEDFSLALGVEVDTPEPPMSPIDPAVFGRMIERVAEAFPNLHIVASTLRSATTATRNDWGAIGWADGTVYEATARPDLEILDRVGGGDAFASGLIYGLLTDRDLPHALEYGAAHGALAMTTPGDTSMATLAEVEGLVGGTGARIQR